jgi:hypothetical protein
MQLQIPKHPMDTMKSTYWDLCRGNISRIANLIDYHLTFLQRHLLSSDLNIWMACVRSTRRFVIVNPLYRTSMLQQPQESENSVLRSPNDMADNFGTALFARVLLWGHGVYVNRDNRYLPSDYQNTVENTQKSKIFALTNASNLPSIKEIQKMLRKSITSLSPKQYALLQTIMMDLWATQTFAEPLTSHERKSKRNLETNIDDDEESDNDSTNNSSNDEEKSHTTSNRKVSSNKTNYNYFQQMSQSTGEQDNTNMTTPNVQKNN